VQVFECEFHRFAAPEAVHAKPREVAHDDDLRQIALGDARKVSKRLGSAWSRFLPRDFCSTSNMPGQNRSTKPSVLALAPGSFLTACSNVATRLLVMPKISKKSIQNGLPWLSSLAASSQVRLKFSARDLISFQLTGMVMRSLTVQRDSRWLRSRASRLNPRNG